MKKLEQLGPIQVIVIPSAMHRIDAKRFATRYPNATFVCPEAARAAASEVVDTLEPLEKTLTPHGIVVHTPKGLKPSEHALQLPLQDGGKALLLNDCLFNLGANPPRGFGGFILKLLGSVRPLGITPLGKKLMLEDANDFRDYLSNLSEIDGLRVLCVSHGTPIQESVSDALVQASQRVS